MLKPLLFNLPNTYNIDLMVTIVYISSIMSLLQDLKELLAKPLLLKEDKETLIRIITNGFFNRLLSNAEGSELKLNQAKLEDAQYELQCEFTNTEAPYSNITKVISLLRYITANYPRTMTPDMDLYTLAMAALYAHRPASHDHESQDADASIHYFSRICSEVLSVDIAYIKNCQSHFITPILQVTQCIRMTAYHIYGASTTTSKGAQLFSEADLYELACPAALRNITIRKLEEYGRLGGYKYEALVKLLDYYTNIIKFLDPQVYNGVGSRAPFVDKINFKLELEYILYAIQMHIHSELNCRIPKPDMKKCE